MKRWLSFALIMGALLGLLGQEAAFARMMPVQAAPRMEATSAMSADCAQMMGIAKVKPEQGKPCQGLTLDCIAKMGCAVPLALLPPLASDTARPLRADLPGLVPASPLAGRNFGPEPEPPAHLG